MKKKKLTLVDTNVLARFLVGDQPAQAKRARELFSNSGTKSLLLPDSVLIELNYVLLSHYSVPKGETIFALRSIIEHPVFRLDFDLLSLSLDLYSKLEMSLLDCYLLANYQLKRVDELVTFDKRLSKQTEN